MKSMECEKKTIYRFQSVAIALGQKNVVAITKTYRDLSYR